MYRVCVEYVLKTVLLEYVYVLVENMVTVLLEYIDLLLRFSCINA